MPQTACSRCGATWPETYQFCGRCGHTLQAAPSVAGIPPPPPGPAPVGAARAAIRLVVLRGAVAEGAAYDLREGSNSVGRSGDLAFPGDTLLSARHIVLERSGDSLDLAEITGQGGCFRRIREPVQVPSGAVIFAGEQYMLVRLGEAVPTEGLPGRDDPPEVFGTPLPNPRLHVTQLLAGGLPGRVVSTDREMLTIGREGCDLSFPQDRFMSGRHLRIESAGDGQVQVIDVGSLNGTFIRPTQLPVPLNRGDELLVGSMLFRVEMRED